MKANQILLGDCLDVLKGVPSDSIDALVFDPPYALGTGVPSWQDIEKYLSGGSLDSGGDFMGKNWELPTIPALREILRVLKPGAHCLAFSSTRTFDVLAAGMLKAGYTYQGVRQWVQSQGFPKSSNISKTLDRKAKATREVIGVKPGHEDFAGRETKGHIDFANQALVGFDRPWMHDEGAREQYHLETAPATDDAKKWAGWGSALKPSWEPILVFSKGEPMSPLGGPQFFYFAKSNGREKTVGGEVENSHPTVKPLPLMRQLVKLACPLGSIVLDPYVGSGTTAEAAVREGRQYIAIEKDPAYHVIATKRLEAVDATVGAVIRTQDLFDELFGE